MSLFDTLVDEALRAKSDLHLLRPVVEKELLHHDILREMSEAGLLNGLTFIGGTCLRACYGSERLSEDLDFTGGVDFKKESLIELGDILIQTLGKKYGLPVRVSEPVKEGGTVSTWKMTMETRPGKRHLPAQKIHLDICAIPSHDSKPMMLRNLYGVDLGTSGLILRAESREEILADKIVAFSLRENRIKSRDLWDMSWLVQQGIKLPKQLVPVKVNDHQREWGAFKNLLEGRIESLRSKPEVRTNFIKEMQRFLPVQTVKETVEREEFWEFLTGQVEELARLAVQAG